MIPNYKSMLIFLTVIGLNAKYKNSNLQLYLLFYRIFLGFDGISRVSVTKGPFGSSTKDVSNLHLNAPSPRAY